MPKLKETESLYVRTMGKALKVTALFTSDDDANEFMAKPGNEDAVVAVIAGVVMLANKYDHGITIPKEKT